MSEKKIFDYFYGSQSEQFSFFRLPKALIRDERFRKISSDAKILYGIMLDRMSLSRENKWFDDENRVYIIFTLNDVMKELECCKRKASTLMAELDEKSGIGLIEKRKQGLGKPDLIYLKNFVVPRDYSKEMSDNLEVAASNVLQLQSGKNMQLQSGKNMQLLNTTNAELGDKIAENLKNGKEMQFQSGKNVQLWSSTNMHLKSSTEMQSNNTKNNNTESSDTESINHINQNITEDEMDKIAACRALVKDNISYQSLSQTTSLLTRRMLDEIVELMVEVLVVDRPYLRISGVDYPYALVKTRFMSIGYDHVEYVLDCLSQTSSKIGNVKAYILTSLFNATATIDTYYTAAVNHNMVKGV